MSKTETAAKELDTASLDQIVGAGIIVADATGGTTDTRRQEQGDKLWAEESKK